MTPDHCDAKLRGKDFEMDGERRERGRPRTFPADLRQQLAKLIAIHGISGTARIAPFPISRGTLLTIAREHGIELPKGRRKQAA